MQQTIGSVGWVVVEVDVRLYPTEEGGRKVPLKFVSFIYNLHLRASLEHEASLVEWIGGLQEINPGESGVIQVVFRRSSRILESTFQTGCQVYVFEEPILISEGRLTKRWQIDEFPVRPTNWNSTTDEIRAWAYDENARLADQDEDLILSRPQYRSALTSLDLLRESISGTNF
ncbi:MAG: hypothetical protein LH702_23360 [Phormidesmis sp. CAN_BIN44]|nr:hypothetical protein [Phormidesmis sp. CAN_BIN44]